MLFTKFGFRGTHKITQNLGIHDIWVFIHLVFLWRCCSQNLGSGGSMVARLKLKAVIVSLLWELVFSSVAQLQQVIVLRLDILASFWWDSGENQAPFLWIPVISGETQVNFTWNSGEILEERATNTGNPQQAITRPYHTAMKVYWYGFPSGIIRSNWSDAEKISMAPAQNHDALLLWLCITASITASYY